MSDVGDLLADRYRLQRHLGSGAMGVVWQAADERLQRPVAVKQLLSQPGMDPARAEEARQRAMREGRIAARLHHLNAISVYDVAEDDGLPLLVMEYLPSRSLADLLTEQGAMAPTAVAAIGVQAASALTAAHEAGIVHRDIKPGNILLGDDGSIKITDFGISHAAGDIAVTQTGVLAGTPAYLAPEIARGHPPTPESDFFSLAATLYAATEGRAPFVTRSENSLALLQEVAAGNVQPPQRAGLLAPVLARMLHADPAQRLTPGDSRAALQAVASGRQPFDDISPTAPTDWHTQPLGANSAGRTTSTQLAPTQSAAAPHNHGPNGTSLRPATGAAGAARPRRKIRRLPIAAIAVLAVLLGLAVLTQWSPTGQTPPQRPLPTGPPLAPPPPPQQTPPPQQEPPADTGNGEEDKKGEKKKKGEDDKKSEDN